MKPYKAVFFDWDGTAVYSRNAPTEEIVAAMRPLLERGVALAIISGTTIENIAKGKLHEAFTPAQRSHLFYGLARGAVNYRFDERGELCPFASAIPDRNGLALIHEACFRMHQWLLKDYEIHTDIVFTRPNYCKIDLMAAAPRGDQLFLQEGEMERLAEMLESHGVQGGVETLIHKAEAFGSEFGIQLRATSDAKFLEVGPTLKSDNVNAIFDFLGAQSGLKAEDCSFWGDEFISVGNNQFGSDSYMLIDKTRQGDFFDVSDLAGERPPQVVQLGGGVKQFIKALAEMNERWSAI